MKHLKTYENFDMPFKNLDQYDINKSKYYKANEHIEKEVEKILLERGYKKIKDIFISEENLLEIDSMKFGLTDKEDIYAISLGLPTRNYIRLYIIRYTPSGWKEDRRSHEMTKYNIEERLDRLEKYYNLI